MGINSITYTLYHFYFIFFFNFFNKINNNNLEGKFCISLFFHRHRKHCIRQIDSILPSECRGWKRNMFLYASNRRHKLHFPHSFVIFSASLRSRMQCYTVTIDSILTKLNISLHHISFLGLIQNYPRIVPLDLDKFLTGTEFHFHHTEYCNLPIHSTVATT